MPTTWRREALTVVSSAEPAAGDFDPCAAAALDTQTLERLKTRHAGFADAASRANLLLRDLPGEDDAGAGERMRAALDILTARVDEMMRAVGAP